MAAMEVIRDYNSKGIPIIRQRLGYETRSMGELFDNQAGVIVLVPGPVTDMNHREIGVARHNGTSVIHRYARLSRHVYSVAGDANPGPDARVTSRNHVGRVVFVGLYPPDQANY